MGLAVAHEGTSLSPEELQHLFSPFYRRQGVASTERDLGLGLYLTQEFVHHQGGEIAVANRPSGGTVVSFTIPIDEGAALAA